MTGAVDPLSPILDALAARLAPLVADLVVAKLAEAKPVHEAPTGLVDKATMARELGLSAPTIDRLCREGMPFTHAGCRRRFSIPEAKAWIARRGRRATTASATPKRTDAIDVDDVLSASGLRRA